MSCWVMGRDQTLMAARLRRIDTTEDDLAARRLRHDVHFEITTGGDKVWSSDRIAEVHPYQVDQFADGMENEVGAVNLGQIGYNALLADGVLSERSKQDIVAWWAARVRIWIRVGGQVVWRIGVPEESG